MFNKFFKFSCAAMILCSAVVSSCNDEDDDKSGTFDGTIEGTLDAALAAEIDTIVATFDRNYDPKQTTSPFVEAPVKDGKIKLTLPTPGTNDLRLVQNSKLEISPADAKAASCIFYTIKDGRAGNSLNVRKSETIEVSFMYADKDVTARGTITDGGEEGSSIITYDYNLKKGWNVIIFEKSLKIPTRLKPVAFLPVWFGWTNNRRLSKNEQALGE